MALVGTGATSNTDIKEKAERTILADSLPEPFMNISASFPAVSSPHPFTDHVLGFGKETVSRDLGLEAFGKMPGLNTVGVSIHPVLGGLKSILASSSGFGFAIYLLLFYR
jgi:hypothetical protein